MPQLDLDGSQISACLGALDAYRKSLVRAQSSKGIVAGLPEVYQQQIKLVDGAIAVFRAVPLQGASTSPAKR